MEIIFEDVNYSYKKVNYQEKEVLEDVNLKIKSEKINAIVGKSGSGKTTLLNLLNQDLLPTKGKIKINDKVISNKKDARSDICIDIGYVSENPKEQFFYQTVYKELESILQMKQYKLDKIEKRIYDVLLMVGLDKDKLNQNPNTLSHGEVRKLAIAEALISNPKILIFDSPTTNLDIKSKNEFIKLLRLLKSRYNKTIIISSNDLDFVHKISDYIFVLYNKKVILEGTKYDVFKDSKQLKKYGLISPKVMLFSDIVLSKKNIKLGYRDEINDLIKDIYRSSY